MCLEAYVAGLLDGEGSIHIGCYKGKYRLSVQVTNGNEKAIRLIADNWGGTVSKFLSQSGKLHYRYHIVAARACSLLRDVWPYSIIKEEHIKLAIEFQERRNNSSPPEDEESR